MQATLLEATWTAIMFFGLAFDGRLVRRAVHLSRRRRQTGKNGLAKIAVRKNMRGLIIRLVLWSCFFIVGVGAMSFGPNTPQSLTFVVNVGGLFAGVLAMLVGSFLDNRDMNLIDAYADAQPAPVPEGWERV